jgi:tetratricopeptide (TPR) repeat protein
MSRQISPFLWCTLALAACGSWSLPASGVEPAKRFLDGLRERGYYDVALDYLDTAADNPAVPVQFKETLLFERGLTLVEGAPRQRDAVIREKWLSDGQRALTEFVTGQPHSPLVVNARNQLGNVIVERARLRAEESQKRTGDAKNQALAEARQLYEEARKIFEGQVADIRERLKQYPASLTEKDGKPFEERANFRKEYLQSRLLVTATGEEIADTYPAGSPERSKLLEEAAGGYQEIYEDYRTLLAGYYARLYQARCLARLGRHKEAIGFFTELLELPESPEPFYDLRVKTAETAIDSWMAEKQYGAILEKVFPVVDKARPKDDRTDEFMAMRLKVARAARAFADQIKAKTPNDPQIKALLRTGRELALYVSRLRNPYQDEARKLIAEFAGADPDAVAASKPDPKAFPEARDAGREALDRMEKNRLLAKEVADRLPTIRDAAQRAQMQAQVEQAQQAAEDARSDAYRYLQMAVQMADAETDSNDLNLVRYYLCYLEYAAGNYFDAAVIGEFIARHHPDHQGARKCAQIAMACWQKLYHEKLGGDNAFEAQRIVAIADYITQNWAESPEAEEALNTLIPFMIREKKLTEAQAYLDKIPADSPHRGTAELRTGQALWAAYLEGSRELREWEQDPQRAPEGFDPQARRKELDELKAKAEKTLTDGVARMQATGEVTNVVATAVFSLAQIYADTNQADKAIALLEDPKMGPLTLLAQKHPAMQKEGFDIETYKTALRAYISGLADAKEPQTLIDKAKAMMDALKAAMGEGGQNRLVAIYVEMARELQTQMELADDATKKGMAQGFEVFLNEVVKEATELNVLNWVAETYRAMGESFLSSKSGGTAAAAPYLQKAIDAYQKILAQATKDAASSALATQTRLQMARTYRAMNKYKESMDMFEEILRPQQGRFLLPVQIEAAKTYQDWGDKGAQFKDRYRDAIFGARPDKTNPDRAKQAEPIVWGWGQISKMTAGNPKYLEQFHEARYNLALCRYRWALAEKDAALKSDRLARARSDIATTVAFYKDLGGPKWEAQYDRLLKDIQRALGERPTGIAGLRAAQEATTSVGTGVGKSGTKPTTKAASGKPPSTPAVKPKVNKTSTK